MGYRLTQEEWIQKAKAKHNDFYDYSKIEYINSASKVCIICPEHGEFWQEANSHLKGAKCIYCRGRVLKHTTESFIQKAQQIHGDKYDYSLVDYVNNHTKVKIICRKHGEFEQQPSNHLSGQDCYYCSEKAFTNQDFIDRSKEVHNNKYNYSLTNYTGNRYKVKIICPIHGEFEQQAASHLNGSGCRKCSAERSSVFNSDTLESFIEKANKLHFNKYDYSKVEYIDSYTKVEIICPEHGSFIQLPSSHLQRVGCPICKTSHGEKIITNWLKENKIIYYCQYKFDDCRYKNPLPFDFYLPELKMCIEYDGEHHYSPVNFNEKYSDDYWENSFKLIQLKDEIKNQFCENRNIKLLRISYLDKDNIESILLENVV